MRLDAGGGQSDDVADSYGSLALLYVARDQLPQAVAYRRKAVAIREGLFGSASSEAADARADLAQTLFEEALALIESRHGSTSTDIVAPLNNLAYNERAQRRLDRAEAGKWRRM